MKVKKHVCILLSGCLVVHAFCIAYLAVIPAFALNVAGLQSTIAGIIISLLLQTGTAPVNQTYIDALNASYGIESSIGTIGDAIQNGLLTDTGSGLIDTGLSTAIANQPAYTELGIAELFTTSTDDVAGGVIAGSGALNLTNTAIHCGTVGTIGAFAGAATVGVGLGVLIDKVRNYIGDYVKFGLPMSANSRRTIAENFPEGYNACYYRARRNLSTNRIDSRYYFVSGDSVVGAYYNNGNVLARIVNIQDTPIDVLIRSYDNSAIDGNDYPFRIGSGTWSAFGYGPEEIENNFPVFDTEADMLAYIQSVQNGEIPSIYSPDIIGNYGNQLPNEVINMIPNGYDMKPVDMDNYQDFADEANDNTENNLIEEPQSQLLNNIIDEYLVAPSMIPDQGVEIPEIPDRPIIPGQPEIPEKDPINSEEQELINSGLGTTDLANVFPFCIPFDLYSILQVFKNDNREAPKITFTFPESIGGWEIEIDLSPFDSVASILRTLELILFIIGLAVNTRNLIGAT